MNDDADKLNPIEEERRALDLIARSPEGHLMHRWLRRILEAVIDIEPVSALQAHNGRRSLARDLMRLMAEGIEATSDGSKSDKSILGRQSGARAGVRPRGTVRRVALEPGDGWLSPGDYESQPPDRAQSRRRRKAT